MKPPGCDISDTSWAWIDPNGNVFELGGETHRTWAEMEVGDEDNSDPVKTLIMGGWIAAGNAFNPSFAPKVAPKAMAAMVDAMILCAKVNHTDPERPNTVFVDLADSWSWGHRKMSVAEFVELYGGKKYLDKLFKTLLGAAMNPIREVVAAAKPVDALALGFILRYQHRDAIHHVGYAAGLKGEHMEEVAWELGYENEDYDDVLKGYESLAKRLGADLRKSFDDGKASA